MLVRLPSVRPGKFQHVSEPPPYFPLLGTPALKGAGGKQVAFFLTDTFPISLCVAYWRRTEQRYNEEVSARMTYDVSLLLQCAPRERERKLELGGNPSGVGGFGGRHGGWVRVPVPDISGDVSRCHSQNWAFRGRSGLPMRPHRLPLNLGYYFKRAAGESGDYCSLLGRRSGRF